MAFAWRRICLRLVERVWVQHCDAQWMSGSNGVIRDCRVSDSWGDGINLNNSNMPRPDANGVNATAGINLAAINNYVRGNGDDGIATYSDGGKDGKNPQMVGTRIIGNTSVAPFWANALRVAGGKNVVVRNNLCLGSSSNSGMNVGVFGKSGNPLVSALIENNVIIGGGVWNVPDRRHGLTIGSVYQDIILRNNLVKNSRRSGIYLSGKVVVTLENNTIAAPAASGVLISEKAEGTGIFKRNSFEMLQPGEKKVVNTAPDKFKIQNVEGEQ
jgi:hypothetical protein